MEIVIIVGVTLVVGALGCLIMYASYAKRFISVWSEMLFDDDDIENRPFIGDKMNKRDCKRVVKVISDSEKLRNKLNQLCYAASKTPAESAIITASRDSVKQIISALSVITNSCE